MVLFKRSTGQFAAVYDAAVGFFELLEHVGLHLISSVSLLVLGKRFWQACIELAEVL